MVREKRTTKRQVNRISFVSRLVYANQKLRRVSGTGRIKSTALWVRPVERTKRKLIK